MESELGRFNSDMSVHMINGRAMNLRIKTAGYRRIICMLTRCNTFRNAAEIFNETYHRKGTSAELSYGTLAGDIEQEGRMLIERKQKVAGEILVSHGFNENGKHPGKTLPEEYRNQICTMLSFSGEEMLQDIIPGWHGENTEIESPDMIDELSEVEIKKTDSGNDTETRPETSEGKTEKEPRTTAKTEAEENKDVALSGSSVFSEADYDRFEVKHERRGSRKEVEDEAKKNVCVNFAKWFNSVTKKEIYGIVHDWQIEKKSDEVVYICIDAVLVAMQAETRRKKGDGSHDETVSSNEQTKKISHMNIKVEAGKSSYYITSVDTEEAFRELVAVILKNGLYKRYMVFFIDGELSLAEHIKEYCGKWEHTVYLDWLHLEHKCFELLSMAIAGRRVADPRGTVEYYKIGAKKGEIKTQEYTSLSRLYARALVRILWVGNVDEAIKYLSKLDPAVVKNKKEVAHLIQYLENKRKWITCYALRKKAGLKNSSNGVECQNNVIVAERQKNSRSSWRPEGSSFLSSIATLFCNGESDRWFNEGKISFSMAL